MNQTGSRQLNRGNSAYIHGNAVRKAAPVTPGRQPLKPVSTRTQRNRAKAMYVNFGYLMFIVVAVVIAASTLFSYISLRSELTVSIKQVARLESEYNSIKMNNDETLARIDASINLEEIKRIAVEELGMSYAKEGQIVVINDEGNDYVRQMKKLP